MHAPDYILSCPHTCPCASTSTHRHMHTPMFMNLCTYSLSQTHPHTLRWAGTCVPALSWGTHTDTHAHTAMYMHLSMHSLSQTHTHMHTPMCMQLCVCSLTYTHAHPKGRPVCMGTLSGAHTRTCILTHPCACTCQCAHEHRVTYTHVSSVWDTRGTDRP